MESWGLFLGYPGRFSVVGCFWMLLRDGLNIPLTMGGLLDVDELRPLWVPPWPAVEDEFLAIPKMFLSLSTRVKSPSVFLRRRDVSSSSST